MITRSLSIVLATVVGLHAAVSSTSALAQLTINYANVSGATIEFTGTGDTFTFVPTPGDDFMITSVNNGAGDSVGLKGVIDGTFTIGAISSPAAGIETAPVTGAGMLTITDGAALDLTADLAWVSITTAGSLGGLNGALVVNLTNIVYGGTVADLLALAAAPAGTITSTFQFNPAMSLTALTTDGSVASTSYSGSIVPVPESASGLIWLVGSVAGIGITIWLRRRTVECCA